MPPPSRREKEKQKVRKSNALEWAKQQSSGSDASAVKVPSGYEFYKPEPGVHKVDFMPYIAGAGNPRADEGIEHFEREYEVHWVPSGGRNAPYLCRLKCFNKKCAPCDWRRKHGATADPELLKELREKLRHLWLVNDKPGNFKNKPKVFDTNHFNRGLGFGEQLVAAFNSVEDYANFSDLENGYTLQLTVAKQTMGGGKTFNAVTRVDFLPRKYEYPRDYLDLCPCLDDMLIDPGYDDVMSLLERGTSDSDPDGDKEQEEETPTKRSSSRKPRDEDPDDDDDGADKESDEDDQDDDEPAARKKPSRNGKKEKTAFDLDIKEGDFVMYDDIECEVIKVSGDGTSLTLESEEEEKFRGVDPNECTKVKTKEDEEESDDDEPEEKPRRGRKPVAKDEDDEDDSEEDPDEDDSDTDEEDDEEPTPRRSRGRR